MSLSHWFIYIVLSIYFYYHKCSPQLKEKTMDNAKLLLQIDNAKLANDDFKNK